MVEPENLFLDRIINRVAAEPERQFSEIWSGGAKTQLTWGALGRRAREFGQAYLEQGVGAGDVVFIILKHSADVYPAFLGAMLLGAVPSFLPFPNAKQDSGLYWESQLAVFQRTGAKLLLTFAELVEKACDKVGADVRVITANDVPASGKPFPSALPSETEVALLQHSSGTTGLKKGVMLSYEAIRRQVESYALALQLGGGAEVFASWLPLYHDMGLVACFLTPMYLGIPIISLDAFEWTNRPHSLLEAIDACRATHVWLPNFAFAHIARATPKNCHFDFGSLRALIGCSEPNRTAIFDQFVTRFHGDGIRLHHLQTCYAMAETVFAVSQSRLDTAPRRLRVCLADDGSFEIADGDAGKEFLSNGFPIDGMEVKILTDGRPCGEKTVGEICVRAPYLFTGYFNDKAMTTAAFVDGFFRTGDLGFIYEGEVYVLGRLKELIIANGRNFFAGDFESAISEVQGIKGGRCVAFGVYLPKVGSEQIVIVAERNGTETPDREIENAVTLLINRNFGTAAGDVRIVEPGWLVKTTSGKISRAANARKYVEIFRREAEVPLNLVNVA